MNGCGMVATSLKNGTKFYLIGNLEYICALTSPLPPSKRGYAASLA